jgi:nitric oxide reductase subunit B
MNKQIPVAFIILALLALLFGSFMGLLAGTQYIVPSFLKELLPFNQLREVHVTSMLSWIILCATGGIYYYVSVELGNKLFSKNLAAAHFILFAVTGIAIYLSLFTGNMGGREYLTFFPWLMIPILLGWVLFGINFFKTLLTKVVGWPVYMWMWGTGIVFMVFHLCESNFWIFDYFRGDYIRDLTVQWKSNGSFTGSWNLLVYGTAIFLMTRIKGEENIARSKTAFFFYFLGLANLMFGWAHHIYPVPGMSWIRVVGYAISMSEWLVLAYLITQWILSLSQSEKRENPWAYRMLMITDVWIILNVFIAVLISIPAINHFTHGSHVTVAHSMGTTIGINTPILLASVIFILSRIKRESTLRRPRLMFVGVIIFNISLLIFLSSLILAGIIKGQLMYGEETMVHGELMDRIKPYLCAFLLAGFGVFTGLTLIVTPILRELLAFLSHKANDEI